MEFEQKAEEKKMSMSKNIARLAVTAGLTAALSFGRRHGAGEYGVC